MNNACSLSRMRKECIRAIFKLELNVVDSAIDKVSLPWIRKCHQHKGVESVDFVFND